MASEGGAALLDSSVLIAYFDTADPHSANADALMEALERRSSRVLLSTLVIQEVLTLLLYRKQIEAVDVFNQYIQGNSAVSVVVCDMAGVNNALNLARSRKWLPKLSLTDWCLAEIALHSRIPLYTFDRQLEHLVKRLRKIS